jgi:hypothetical protein
VDGRQSDVPGGDRAATLLLEIPQEPLDHLRRQLFDGQLLDRMLDLLTDKRQEQDQRITVAGLGIAGQIAFADEMLQQKSTNPWAE